MSDKKPLFEIVGGYDMLRKVHKIFYDKIYKDPWIGQFFEGIDQTTIENQQTDFMAQSMGGPEKYSGALPLPAHTHIYITPELFDYRHELLRQSLVEAGLKPETAESWLKIDAAFKRGLVKKSLSDCKPRYTTDEILDFPDPRKLRKAS